MRIAVIGAGLAGLSCASMLQAGGHTVRLFEKASGPGGRLSTTRRDNWQADLGAQYFTVRDPSFKTMVTDWEQAGLAAPWQGRLVWLEQGQSRPVDDDKRRYVGTPRMSAISRHLAQGLDVQLATRVTDVRREKKGLRLSGEDGADLGAWSHVVISAPAPQAEQLLHASPELSAAAASADMRGCWTLVARYTSSPTLPFDGAFVLHQPLRWIARDSSKPDRAPGQIWVMHADSTWSEQHMETPPEDVGAMLLDCLRRITGVEATPELLRLHRWRYASSAAPLKRGYLLDHAAGLSACGDWCHGDRVEGAWTSGRLLAEALLAAMD